MSNPRRVLASLRGLLHTAFLGLVVLGVVRMLAAGAPARAFLGSVQHGVGVAVAVLVIAVYLIGTLAFRPSIGRRPTRHLALMWLGVVTLLWCALCVLGPDFVWIAFPLFFWHLQLLRRRHAVLAVGLLTAVTVASQWFHAGHLGYAMVLGPTIGAIFSVIIAIAYDELSSAQREIGQQAERARLAREIHDTLAQGLSGIVLLSRQARTSLAGVADAHPARELLTETEQIATANLAEARRFVRDLTPPDLSSGGLVSALRRLADRSSTPALPVRVQVDGEPRALTSASEVALLRAAQASVRNARQHAEAHLIMVSLSFAENSVSLDIFDDGRGFDPATLPPPGTAATGGFGLAGLRDRIAAVGGRLQVESAPGEGTVIAVRLDTEPSTQPEGSSPTSTPGAASARDSFEKETPR